MSLSILLTEESCNWRHSTGRYSPIHSLSLASMHSLPTHTQSPTHALNLSSIYTHTLSLSLSLSRSHSVTHSPTHALTHLLADSYIITVFWPPPTVLKPKRHILRLFSTEFYDPRRASATVLLCYCLPACLVAEVSPGIQDSDAYLKNIQIVWHQA